MDGNNPYFIEIEAGTGKKFLLIEC